MILINWNVQWARPLKRPEILNRIQTHKPELVCLTETVPDWGLMNGGHVIHSGLDYGLKRSDGCKVLLWSANPWRDKDCIGSKDKDFPPGRFISGITQTSLGDLLIVGVCIPHMKARGGSWAVIKREDKQDHEAYLRELKPLLAKLIKNGGPFVLVGDFNQRIDAARHYVPVALQDLLRSTLGSLAIPTSAAEFNFNGKPSIDHICLQGLKASSVRPIDNHHAGKKLSDHFGIMADLRKGSRI